MDNDLICHTCCHCVVCGFTGEFCCEKEEEAFPVKCESYEQCYGGEE